MISLTGNKNKGLKKMRKNNVIMLTEGAVMVALAVVLSFIKIIRLPWGGSVTLLSMLPLAVFSIKYGIKKGLAASFLFSLVQLAQGIGEGLFAWGLTSVSLMACIFIDYIGAYTVIGLSGMFRSKGIKGWVAGISSAVIMRFLLHFISGVTIWHSFGKLWEGFVTDNTYLYSLVYNGCYMLPELIFTVMGAAALFSVPQTRRLILSQLSKS